MSSERKIEANRANAQHSTGPQTEEGKATASLNARKHGLSSQTLFIPPDRNDEFKELYTEYYNELRPIGPIQTDYFEQLIHARWNLHIARELHARALYDLNEPKIATAARYIVQFERSFAKAHKALKEEQTDLALRALPENEPIAPLPMACQIKVIANEATKLHRRHPAQRHAALYSIAHAFGVVCQNEPTAHETSPEALDEAA
jgi:hypothetical protein